MATTIQISEKLQDELSRRKLYDRESYEEVIWDMVEDSMELNEQTKGEIEQSLKEIKEGKFYTFDEIKKKMKDNV